MLKNGPQRPDRDSCHVAPHPQTSNLQPPPIICAYLYLMRACQSIGTATLGRAPVLLGETYRGPNLPTCLPSYAARGNGIVGNELSLRGGGELDV